MNTISVWDRIALALVIVGAINWGLVGLFQFDLIATLFGATSIVARIIYVVVGISGLWCLSLFFRSALGVREQHRTVTS
jgi:uncharacterized membrane protein YuzA (DUF378 family)